MIVVVILGVAVIVVIVLLCFVVSYTRRNVDNVDQERTDHIVERTKYIDGEHRFKHKNTKNAKKFIQVWAEKEFRNLKRIG